MLYYLFAGLYTVVVTVGVGLFIARSDLEPIKSREFRPAVASALWAWVFFVVTCVAEELADNPNYADVSCLIVVWPGILTVPLWISPYFARSFMLFYRFRLAKARMNGMTKEDETWLFKYRWLIKRPLWIGLTFIVIFVIVLVGGLISNPANNFVLGSGCAGPWDYFILTEAIYSIVGLGLIIVVCFRSNDVFWFRNELISLGFIAVPFTILWAVGFRGVYPFDSTVFVLVMMPLTFIVSIIVPVYLSYTQFYILGKDESTADDKVDLATVTEKVSIQDISSGTLLEAVLREETLLKAFKKFTTANFCTENLLFVLDAQKYPLYDEISRETEGLRLYQLYFLPNATLEINVDKEVVDRIRATIEQKTFPADLFTEAEQKVYLLLKTDTIKKWRLTSDFMNALKNSTLAEMIDLSPKKKTVLAKVMKSVSSGIIGVTNLKSGSAEKANDYELEKRNSVATFNSTKNLISEDKDQTKISAEYMV